MDERDLPVEARELLARIREAPSIVSQLREELEGEIARTRSVLDETSLRAQRDREFAEVLVRNRISAIEILADAWADYELALSSAEADALRRKTRPARKAAQAVRAKSRALSEERRRAKQTEWLVAFYEWHFPWLSELRDPEADEGYLDSLVEFDFDSGGDQDDPVARWLSKEEFAALSSAERNQLALDRYLRSRKTNWEIGRDYERYIGYLREREGYRVSYQGIFKGLEDLGRDLIAERDKEIEVIQCKRWSEKRTIHEKHVFQLFGTMTALRIDRPDRSVRGTFTTSTALSERAKEFAEQLGIKVEEKVPMSDYPRIKCNVARGTGERIYHLPFDQMYDAAVIEPERGERYVAIAAEAEALDFRRAWRWRPGPT